MPQFIRGVLHQLGNHAVFHGSLCQFRAQPVLVVGQPLVGKRPVEESQKLFHIHSNYLTTLRSHGLSSFRVRVLSRTRRLDTSGYTW